jgi:two-component system cell cycle response regulator
VTARVLVVDDSAGSMALLQAQLASEYLEVIPASDGAEALVQVARCQPDLVLLDAIMPGLSGFDVCRRLRADPATTHLPVVMVTTLDQPEDRMAAFQAGADDFMTKPIHMLTLMARVRRLVQSKMVIDELRIRGHEDPGSNLKSRDDITFPDVDVTGGQVLLVIEDRDVIRDVRLALSPSYQLHIDRDAEDALLVVQRAELDLIMIDLSHTGTDGLRVCSRLRSMEATRDTPLLALLQDDQKVARVRTLEIGVDGIVTPPIHPGELLACVASRLRRKRFSDHLRNSLRASLDRLVKDPLTSMHNRRYLEQHLGPLVAQNSERGRPVSLLIVDVDHFKAVNDTYGHDVGDEVLREVAHRITSGLRGIDLACRFGGEEFVAAFAGVDVSIALQIGERLRRLIADRPFPVVTEKGPLQVTISIGVAASRAEDTSQTLLKRADLALYRAKKEGRNRVVADA